MHASQRIHLVLSCLLIPVRASGAPGAGSPAPEQPPPLWFTVEASTMVSRGVEFETPEGGSFELDSSRYSVRVGCTSTLGRPGELSATLRHERISLSAAEGAWRVSTPQDFNDTGLELSLLRPIDERWTLLLIASPGWRTVGDDGFSSDGFGALLAGMALFQVGPSLQFGFGAVADTLAEGGNRLLPIGGMDWTISERWRLQLGLPRTGLFFTPTEVLELGLVADADFNTYHIPADEDFPDSARLGLSDTKVEYLDVRYGLEATWHLAPTASLSVTAGVVGARRVEFPTQNVVIKTEGLNGGYLKAALSLRF